MAKEYYTGKLIYPENRNVNWNGDVFTSGLQVRGDVLQKYLKQALECKVGDLFFQQSTNKILCFSNVETRELYLSDPVTYQELLLGSFDSISIYDASITLDPDMKTSNVVSLGSTGNSLRFTFDITNKSGASIGDSVLATITIRNGGLSQSFNANLAAGAHADINIDKYLTAGTNNVTISIVGNSSLVGTSIALTYTVVDISLGIDLDNTITQTPTRTQLEVGVTVAGSGIKIVEWYLDGEQQPYDQSTDYYTNNAEETRTRYFDTSGMRSGLHALHARVRTTIGDQTFYSKSSYVEFIVNNDDFAEEVNLLAFNAEFDQNSNFPMKPENLVLSGFTQYNQGILSIVAYNSENKSTMDLNVELDNISIGEYNIRNREETDVPFTPKSEGSKSLVLYVDNKIARELILLVEATNLNLREITNNLVLDFSAEGRNNNSINRNQWSYGAYSANFTGFNWNARSGWIDNSLKFEAGSQLSINYAPLGDTPTAQGRTIEIEMTVNSVTNTEEVICNLMNGAGVGLKLTATDAILRSQAGNEMDMRYRAGDRVRLSIVINRAQGSSNAGLAFIFVNGYNSRCISFDRSDNFNSDVMLTFHATENVAFTLHHIRIYNSALIAGDLENNYILYRPTTAEMLDLYNANNIMNQDGTDFDQDTLANFVPVMLVTGDIPKLESTTDKNETIVADVEFTDNQRPEYGFTFINAAMRPQGTSSMTYPHHNFRIYTKRRNDTIVYDHYGNVVADKLYSFKKRAIPVPTWCLKADYAESSSTHNTGVARVWNEAMTNANITDAFTYDTNGQRVNTNYALRTRAQQAALDEGYPYDVRTTIDGYPIVLFYRLNDSMTPVCMGKFNFNNDKSTPKVFGFEDVPGFDNSKVECWEFTNNKGEVALFTNMANYNKSATEGGVLASFEARYPDDGGKASEETRAKDPNGFLYGLCHWMNSCKNNQAKFNAEWKDHWDPYKLAAYYVYLTRFGAVDQYVKNAMLQTEDGIHGFYINYDNDTVLGLRNDGILIYPPTIDRTTYDDTVSDYACAGHDSVLWNCAEACEEFMQMVPVVDRALYISGLSYEKVLDVFETTQSEKWCMKVYNRDMQYKYIDPYIYDGKRYLEFLQGSRSSHRKWWLNERFALYDSLWVSGSYQGHNISFLAPNTPLNTPLSITAGMKFNYGYGINNNPIRSGVSLNKDQSATWPLNQNLGIGDPVRVYAATRLKVLNLSGFANYMTNIDLEGGFSETEGTLLETLKLSPAPGESLGTYLNLTRVSALGNLKELRNLYVAGFLNLTELDVSQLSNLEKLYAVGSGITTLEFADSAPLELLYTPASLRSISIDNCTTITAANFVYESLANIVEMRFHNVPGLTQNSIVINDWLAAFRGDKGDCSISMDNINWVMNENQLSGLLTILDKGGKLDLRGVITVDRMSDATIAKLEKYFGSSVFNPRSELYVSTSRSVYIISQDSYEEGGDYQIRSLISGISDYTEEWYVITNRPGVSIGRDTGILHIEETGSDIHDMTLRLIVKTQDETFDVKKPADLEHDPYIQITNRNYPSTGRLELVSSSIERLRYNLVIEGTYSGDYSVDWSLETQYAGFEIGNHTKSLCILENTNQLNFVYGVLTCVVKDANGNPLFTITEDVIYRGTGILMDVLSNPQLTQAFHDAGIAAAVDHVMESEVVDVTGEQLKAALALANNPGAVTSFNEFQSFVAVTELVADTFKDYTALESIRLPLNLTSLKDNAIKDPVLNSDSLINVLSIVTTIAEGGLWIKNDVTLDTRSKTFTLATGAICVESGGLTLRSENGLHDNDIVITGADGRVILPATTMLTWTKIINITGAGGTLEIPRGVVGFIGELPINSSVAHTVKLPSSIHDLDNLAYGDAELLTVDATACTGLETARQGSFVLMKCRHETEETVRTIFTEGFSGEISDGHTWASIPTCSVVNTGNVRWNRDHFTLTISCVGRINYYDGYVDTSTKYAYSEVNCGRNTDPDPRNLSGTANFDIMDYSSEINYSVNQNGKPQDLGTMVAVIPVTTQGNIQKIKLLENPELSAVLNYVDVRVTIGGTLKSFKLYEGNMFTLNTAEGTISGNATVVYYLRAANEDLIFGKEWLGTSISSEMVELFECRRMFANCPNLQNASFNELRQITGDHPASYMFANCPELRSVSMPKLANIEGDLSAATHMFENCQKLNALTLTALEEVQSPGETMNYFLFNCRSLTTVNLGALEHVAGKIVLENAFSQMTALTSLALGAIDATTGGAQVSFGLLMAVHCVNLQTAALGFSMVNGDDVLCAAFLSDTALQSLDLSSLSTITARLFALQWMLTSDRQLSVINIADAEQSDVKITLDENFTQDVIVNNMSAGTLAYVTETAPDAYVTENKNALWYYLTHKTYNPWSFSRV